MTTDTDNSPTEILTEIVKAIVYSTDQVFVTEVDGESTQILELSVAKEDLGRVIGKQGRTARAIRTIMMAIAAKTGNRVFVEIID